MCNWLMLHLPILNIAHWIYKYIIYKYSSILEICHVMIMWPLDSDVMMWRNLRNYSALL